MVSTFTPSKHLEQPANNDDVDTWDVPVNGNMGYIDIALGGSTLLNATALSGNVALALAEYRPFALLITGAPTAATNYQVPSGVGGFWSVFNGTTGGKQISVGSAAGGSAINIPVGTSVFITCDGSVSGMRVANTPVAVAGGSTTQVQYNSSGILAGSAGFTFDGTTVAMTGLNVGGDTVLGTGAGSTLLLNGTALSAPNGLNINTGALFLTGSQLGVGTTAVGGNTITAAGLIQSLSGGFKFPDGTTQATAAAAGTSPGGATGNVQFNNAGAFAGQSNFTFNTGTGVLTVPALGITTPLAVTMGGTGVGTSTGTGSVVLGTAPTISNVTLTGTPQGPTAALGNNSTQLATTAYVDSTVRQSLHCTPFTANGTFTPTVSGTYKVTRVGGGNGGYGGPNVPPPVNGTYGGGAGATVITLDTLVAGTPYAVTVGAGGAGGGTGGGGGGAGTASTFNGVSAAPGAGVSGGTAVGGLINIAGGDGNLGGGSSLGGYGNGGNGGASSMGGGGLGGPADPGGAAPGAAGRAYGSGGGGGSAQNSAGGAGAPGIVIIEWVGT